MTPVLLRRDSAPGGPARARPGDGVASPDVAWRPRVAMVVESCGGGTGRHVIDLCQGLVRRGCEVHLLFSLGRVESIFLDRLAALDGIHCKPLPMRREIHSSDLTAVRAARRYLKEHGPFDVVHGHSSKGGAIARLAAAGTGAAAVYTLHGFAATDPTMARWKRTMYLAIELGLSLATARVIAVSPEEKREAVGVGLGRGRVVFVPNGVGESEMGPRDAARAALGAAEGDLIIGFVGRFVSQKAPHVLLQAMSRVAGAMPRAKLALVGGGPLEQSMRAFARQVGVADRVLWLGERDARELMAGFDVFAIPSAKEGLPYVVLEAMSAGLPVVATDRAGVECLVSTGENGVVVPSGDAEALAGGLVFLLRDAKKRAECGRASLRRVARFTVDDMVDKTLAVYAGEDPEAPAVPAAAGAAGSVEAELDEVEVATS